MVIMNESSTLLLIWERSSGGGMPKRAVALSSGFPYPVPANQLAEVGLPYCRAEGGGGEGAEGRAREDDPTQ
jgi:hypothetical protein